MLIHTDRMIPVTKLQKELTQKLREVAETGETLYVLRNNEMAAVILSTGEYELLKQAAEIIEHFEIAETVEKRLSRYNQSKNIPWEQIKRKHGI